MNAIYLIEPFVGPLREATIAFPILASLMSMPFALYHYRKHGRVHPWRAFVGYSFVYYLIVAFFLIILPFPEMPKNPAQLAAWEERYGALRNPNLDPTHFIRAILHAREGRHRVHALSQALFNVLLFIPFGVYIVYLFKRSPPVAALLGLASSLFFELCQLTGIFWIYPGPYRLFDTGDLVSNTTGALLGALGAALLVRWKALPDLGRLAGPPSPWISPVRRGIALVFDATAIAISIIAANASFASLGFGPGTARRAILSGIALFWLVILPALDGGRGLGRRIVLCAIARSDGKKAGIGILLARQSILWAPPALLPLMSDYATTRPWVMASQIALLGIWLALALANALKIAFSKQRAGWIDARLGTRLRTTWKREKRRNAKAVS